MVYFIQGEQTKLIKIGKANSVPNRLACLQSGSPDRLRVLKVIEGARSDGPYHARFHIDRVYGEWFRPSDSLVAFMASIPMSQFDGLEWLLARRRAMQPEPVLVKLADLAKPQFWRTSMSTNAW